MITVKSAPTTLSVSVYATGDVALTAWDKDEDGETTQEVEIRLTPDQARGIAMRLLRMVDADRDSWYVEDVR